jgi:hypothetical protein
MEDTAPIASPQETEVPMRTISLIEMISKRRISGFQCRSTLNRSQRKGAFGAVFLDPMINHDCLTDMNKVVKH